jgi:hypothetical protein
MSNKAKSTAVSPITGEATTITTSNVPAPASMKASGSTLDSIKACARQEFGILLKAESDRASIWRTVLTDHVRVKQDWEAYLREFSLAIADHFGPLYGFDATKGHKTWPEAAQREYQSRFQNQEAQIKRILVAIEKEGLDKVRKIMSGALIRLTDGTYQERKDTAPLGLQEVIKNLPRDSRGRKAKTPTVPQKATVAAAVEGMAPAEFATPIEGKASEGGKNGLAEAAAKQSFTVLADLIGKCPEEFLVGMLTKVSIRLNDELAPEFKNLAVEIGKATQAYRDRKEGKTPAKPAKATAPKGKGKAKELPPAQAAA